MVDLRSLTRLAQVCRTFSSPAHEAMKGIYTLFLSKLAHRNSKVLFWHLSLREYTLQKIMPAFHFSI